MEHLAGGERHRAGSTYSVPALLDALGYEGWFFLRGQWLPMAALDRPTMQQASADPSVFAASDPYIFTFYFLPSETAPAMLARLRQG